jgi:hypothetical protein
MKPEVKELIKTERRRSDFGFITEVVQRGRIKPAKYVHSLAMPVFLYEELRDGNVIIPEDYFIDQLAFFEFRHEKAIVSFVNLYNCEDLHRRILTYLVVKFAGSCPIERTGVSKMNFDRTVEHVVLIKGPKGKKHNGKA